MQDPSSEFKQCRTEVDIYTELACTDRVNEDVLRWMRPSDDLNWLSEYSDLCISQLKRGFSASSLSGPQMKLYKKAPGLIILPTYEETINPKLITKIKPPKIDEHEWLTVIDFYLAEKRYRLFFEKSSDATNAHELLLLGMTGGDLFAHLDEQNEKAQ